MDQVSQIREKIDIVSLISEHIQLKKMGRNFKANCPFHGEKTPSFVVSPERQIWHCFGCGKGGDVYSFLMEFENLEFPEALRILANKAGIELKETAGFETGTFSKKEKIYKLNKLAVEFYHYLLTTHNVGKKAYEYLVEQRKINKKVVETFMLGFAPRMNDSLSNYLINKKKYKKEDLVDAGLASYRGRDVVDFFINRLIFPLLDHRGNVIGFSGRILDDNVQASKYVNTRETLAYHKGEVFFGLNIAKDEIKKENFAIVTEGEFDVISSFQEGIKNIVAVKGTALTESQVNLLSRFTQKVGLCFDTDNAGQEAIKRSLSFLEKKNLITTVIVLTNGKDIDESIKNDPVEFKKAIKKDFHIYDYLLEKTISSFNKKTIDGKKKIGDELLPIFGRIENEIVKEHYFKKLANELDTSYESIVKQAGRTSKNKLEIKDEEKPTIKRTREEILEEYLLALILQSENKLDSLKKVNENLLGFLPKQTGTQKVLIVLLEYFNQKKENFVFKDNDFVLALPTELLPVFNKSFLFSIPRFEEESLYLLEIGKVAKELKTIYLKTKIKLTGEKIKEKEKNESENPDLENVKKEFSDLLVLLNKEK